MMEEANRNGSIDHPWAGRILSGSFKRKFSSHFFYIFSAMKSRVNSGGHGFEERGGVK